MVDKLTLIVTCTDRKSTQPSDRLRFGNLPPGSEADRASLWQEALRSESMRKPLRQLYQGDSWIQALRLEKAAHSAGFAPTLLVASAGLGLVDADDEWPAYAATFSPRHVDSIGSNSAENKRWWNLVTAGQGSLSERITGQALFVLSNNYSSAMADDLNALAGREDVVIFGGSSQVPNDLRIPADRGLRAALGGTSNSLNLRTAIAWINSLRAPTLVGHRHHQEWRDWVNKTRQPEVYDRASISDREVLTFIHQVRCLQPYISKTRALRALRDSGLACEQKRFSALFEGTVKETL